MDKDGRWLGALATSALFECNFPEEAIESWTTATNKDPWEQGCNCCGKPHSFYYEDANGLTHYAQMQTASVFVGWN